MEEGRYILRQYANRQQKKARYRVWIHATFKKEDVSLITILRTERKNETQNKVIDLSKLLLTWFIMWQRIKAQNELYFLITTNYQLVPKITVLLLTVHCFRMCCCCFYCCCCYFHTYVIIPKQPAGTQTSLELDTRKLITGIFCALSGPDIIQ